MMDTITAIKKALEGVMHAPGKWEANGTSVYCDDATGQRVCSTKGDYLFWTEDQKRDAARYIVAVNPVAISEILSTLESLQRENEELKIDASNHAADAETVRRYRDIERRRADAAEAEVKRLRAALEFYADPEIYKPHPHGPAFDRRDLSYHAQSALSSTGDTHGN